MKMSDANNQFQKQHQSDVSEDQSSDAGGEVEVIAADLDEFNDDSERMQDLLENAGFEKDEVEMINEHCFSAQEHLPKVMALFNQQQSSEAEGRQFVFSESSEADEIEGIETGIVVFDLSSKHYIIAKIAPQEKQEDAGSTISDTQQLKQRLLDCFSSSEFNGIQQMHNISETIKLTWLG